MIDSNLAVSFVHGYENLEINLPEEERPALWNINRAGGTFHRYPFPRNPSDFAAYGSMMRGMKPFASAEEFRKLPRFGFTGLAQAGQHLFAGTWNSVYMLDKSSFEMEAIISNNMMSDTHGIHADEDCLITVLTSKDTVVVSDFDGQIKDYFTINRDLSITRDDRLLGTDWRFLSKQFRGSAGWWHFNYVQKFGDQIWLTSRSANCFVIVEPERNRAYLRLLNLNTPAMIHDGRLHDNKFYITSVDGKIIIAEDSRYSDFVQREKVDNLEMFNRDLVSRFLRLSETELNREPNWCRGIAVEDDVIYVTIDGRYDTDLSFGVLACNEDGEIFDNVRLSWHEVGDESEIRYVTGFDIEVLK